MTEFAKVRGFNYVPSWGSSGLEIWRGFDAEKMRNEIARGRELFPGWNTARWWLSHDAYFRNPEQFLENFEAGLQAFDDYGIAVIPVVFNQWRSPLGDWGGVNLEHILPGSGEAEETDFVALEPSRSGEFCTQWVHAQYLSAIFDRHAADPRILAWDLCNGPIQSEVNYVQDAVVRWLTWVAAYARSRGISQPICISADAPQAEATRRLEPVVDVLAFRPYYVPTGFEGSGFPDYSMPGEPGQDSVFRLDPDQDPHAHFEGMLDAAVAYSLEVGKPLLITEAAWGDLDDQARAATLAYALEQYARRGLGYTLHALNHSLVADLHPAEYGSVGFAGRLEFIDADGQLRAGHDVFNTYALPRA